MPKRAKGMKPNRARKLSAQTKAPDVVLENFYATHCICMYLFKHFRDGDRVLLWFRAKNPFLGNVTPVSMVLAGRAERVRQFVLSQFDPDIELATFASLINENQQDVGVEKQTSPSTGPQLTNG